MRHTPFRLPTVLVGTLATAAVMTLSACGESNNNAADPSTASTSPTAASPSSTPTPSESASPTPSESSTASPAGTVPVYFVGANELLFPYPAATAADPTAVLAALTASPADPDYRTLWSPDLVKSATANGSEVTVDLTSAATAGSAATGTVAVQQLVWSMREALGATSVTFTVDGQPATQVLGVAVRTPEKPRPAEKFLSQATIASPLEGATVSGTFEASGTSNGPEAWLGWEILDAKGAKVKEGFTTAEGWMDKLYPWQATVDLNGVPAGTYTFRAFIDDPSGGEGKPADADTRTIVVS